MSQQVISRVDPVYPPDLKASHVGGTVVLAATIDPAGKVQNLSAISGPAPLAEAALAAVRQWRYKPYQMNGSPLSVATTVTVNFQPDGATPATPASNR